YYHIAERILRCHLLPSQLRDVSFINDPPNPANEDGKRDVANRHLGAFGFPAPYGHHPVGAPDISFNMDIVGGAVGSLCEAYRETVRVDAAGCKVNLLFDHETEFIKIESPYPGGILRIHAKHPGPVFVRIPPWVDRKNLVAEGLKGSIRFSNDYLFVSEPPLNEPVSIHLPLALDPLVLTHRTHQIHARLQGDRVIAMENFGEPFTYFNPLA
ncbi:MAG: hypothetical protein LC772_05975, partial [Chloroflexi bacterium]|nr:hypothetical protein [Chloroflexota bacterium]